MMKPTAWELSEMIAKETSSLQPGEQVLRITAAKADLDGGVYTLTLQSVDDDSKESTMYYYLVKKDGTRNERAVGTLNSLSRAVYGCDAGVPFPDDMVNAIVSAEVKSNEYEGKRYLNVYRFDPVDRTTLEAAALLGPVADQYCTERPGCLSSAPPGS